MTVIFDYDSQTTCFSKEFLLAYQFRPKCKGHKASSCVANMFCSQKVRPIPLPFGYQLTGVKTTVTILDVKSFVSGKGNFAS